MRWWDGITNSMDMSLSRLWEITKEREVRRAAAHGVAVHDKTTTINGRRVLYLLP